MIEDLMIDSSKHIPWSNIAHTLAQISTNPKFLLKFAPDVPRGLQSVSNKFQVLACEFFLQAYTIWAHRQQKAGGIENAVKLGSICGEEIQACENWAHMFWAVFQWKLLQSDEAKEASTKGEVNNRRSRQSSEQGSQGRPVCPFFLPMASSQCSACLHYC